MNLKTLKVKNFRQFFGEQTIDFARGDKHVTLINGPNGSGKTALLNAFVWLLYGELTPDVEKPDSTINEAYVADAQPGSSLETIVELVFTEDSEQIHCVRKLRAEKLSTGSFKNTQIEANVYVTDEAGQSNRRNVPDTFLRQLLPKRLYPYFFFNGERIEAIAKADAASQVADAIRSLLGLEVIARAMEHTKKATALFHRELKEFGGERVADLVTAKESSEQKLEDLRQKLQRLVAHRRANEDQLAGISKRLQELEISQKFEEQRRHFVAEKSSHTEQLVLRETALRAKITKSGYFAFTKELFERCSTLLEEKRARRELPRGIKRLFVQDLLDSGTCICNTPLIPGAPPYVAVREWLGKAESQDLEDEYISTRGAITTVAVERQHVVKEIRDTQQQRSDLKRQISSLQEQIDDVDSKLGKQDSEKIRDLISKRSELDEEIRDLTGHIAICQNEIEGLQGELRTLEQELQKEKVKNDKAALAQTRVRYCNEVHERYEAVYTELTNRVRVELSDKFGETYRQICRKDYRATVTADFTLQVSKMIGAEESEVAKSTGENQITSLAFIASLVAYADTLKKKHTVTQPTIRSFLGGVYPVVMDSPFGSLDEDYREQVGRIIPAMASQVILMATKSQWEGPVAMSMGPSVGKRYVLVYHDPRLEERDTDMRREEQIEIHGHTIRLVEKSQTGYEWTEIRSVS